MSGRFWGTAAVVGAAVLCGGVWWYRTPWLEEALVVGQVWTPEFAVGAQIVGFTMLIACAIRGVVALQHRRTESRAVFEVAALAVTGLLVVWLVGLVASGVELIPADARFSETRLSGRDVVVMTSDDIGGGSERVTGVRHGLFVRWGPATFVPPHERDAGFPVVSARTSIRT